MNWNPDDVVLTIWAWREVQAGRTTLASVVAGLAAELEREPTAVEAAIKAVDAPAMQAGVLRLLLPLLQDDRLLNHLIAAIRQVRAAR